MPDLSPTKHRILVIEDDAPVRERLVSALLVHGDCEVSDAASLVEARACLEQDCPDLILSDLNLPDGMAIDFLIETRQRFPKVEILVISVLGDESTILSAITAGATGYLLKDSLPANIHATAMEVLAGGSPISPSIARYVLMRARANRTEDPIELSSNLTEKMTPREMDVLWGIAKGYTYSEIADQLNISGQTVPSHIKSIYRKLRVDNRSSAVYEAVQNGIIKL